MRFAAHLFGIPALSLFIAYMLSIAADASAAFMHLSDLAQSLRYASVGLLLVAVGVLAYNGWRVWQSVNGQGEFCFSCGMPTSHKEGRYGPYFKCWNCGKNRADR